MGEFQTRLGGQLTLFVRQLAWLNAVPKPDEQSRRARVGAKLSTLSRLDVMRRNKVPVPIPPNPAPGMIARLMEIGLSEAAGMGLAPLGWCTIDAWCNRTGVDLPPWESRLLRTLSAAYVAESRKAEDEACPPPWRAPLTQQERDVEQKRLEAVLG